MNPQTNHEGAAVLLDTGTRLAYERTFLAFERTQMAWMRTSLSLISFGFTIAKFFEFEQKRGGTFTPVLGPQTVGTLMIAIGVFSLLLATRQHLKSLKTLNQRCPGLPKSLARYTAGGLALLGLLAFVAALIRG